MAIATATKPRLLIVFAGCASRLSRSSSQSQAPGASVEASKFTPRTVAVLSADLVRVRPYVALGQRERVVLGLSAGFGGEVLESGFGDERVDEAGDELEVVAFEFVEVGEAFAEVVLGGAERSAWGVVEEEVV